MAAAAASKRGHHANGSGSGGSGSNKRKGRRANVKKSATGASTSAKQDPASSAANEEHRVDRTRPAQDEEDEERKNRPKRQTREVVDDASTDDDDSPSSESGAGGRGVDAEVSPKGAEDGGGEESSSEEEDDSKAGDGDHDDDSDEEGDGDAEKGEGGEDVRLQKSSPPDTKASDAPQKPKPEPPTKMISDGRYRNKQRCLVLCSRGVTARYRHLLEDLRTLLPHHKKDAKLDSGKNQVGSGGVGRAVNDIAELKGCNTLLFLECRKRGRDAYLWMSQTGTAAGGGGGAGAAPGDVGPSVRFHLTNVHTMDELKLTGNCMRGSRPVLTFDESFETVPHLRLLKGLFIDVFGTPRGHPKSKPFVDRVMGFYNADNKIWVRNYQIVEEQPTNAKEVAEAKSTGGLSTSLVEIGPRFVLDPIRIFSGSFGGQTLFRNPHFVSPNAVRAERLKRKGSSYAGRKEAQKRRRERSRGLVLPEDPLDSVFR